MVPLSLGRTSSLGARGGSLRDSLAWLRPANVTAERNVDRQALIRGLALFVGLTVAIALGHVWLRLKVVDLGYRLSATRRVIDRLEQEGHELTVEAATLDCPGRLEDVARTRLNMMLPAKGAEVILP